MKFPLVSVIIPFHNCGQYLNETILSVIGQTWPNKELLLINDGSSDHSFAVAKNYENEWIRVFQQAHKGASAARNTGLREAKGEYIQFLDADDLLSPDKIYEQVHLLMANPGKIAASSTIHFDHGSEPTRYGPSIYEDAFLIEADPVYFLINLWGGFSENGSMVAIHSWLTPRLIIEKAGWWDETLTVDDDGEYFCRVLLQSAGVLKSRGYNYYRKFKSGENLSSKKSKAHLLSQFSSLQLRYKHLSGYTSSENLKKAYIKSLYHIQFKAYPGHPDIVNLTDEEIRDLGLSIKIANPFGTATGKALSAIFGWKFVKRLQLLRAKLN